MGRIVKFCSECDEGYMERFTFCPTCGALLNSFEMIPVSAESNNVEQGPFEDDQSFNEDFIFPDEEKLDDDDAEWNDDASFENDRQWRPSSESEEPGPWTLAAQLVKSLFYFVGGLGGLVLVILIFANGVIWYQDHAYPVVSVVTALPVFFLFPSGLVLGVFRKTRGLGGLFLIISSVLYLAGCWSQALAFAYVYAGKVWMLIGFFLAGVGVFFMAFFGAVIQGEYSDAIMIVVSVMIFLVVYFGGAWMVVSRDNLLSREIPTPER